MKPNFTCYTEPLASYSRDKCEGSHGSQATLRNLVCLKRSTTARCMKCAEKRNKGGNLLIRTVYLAHAGISEFLLLEISCQKGRAA